MNYKSGACVNRVDDRSSALPSCLLWKILFSPTLPLGVERGLFVRCDELNISIHVCEFGLSLFKAV